MWCVSTVRLALLGTVVADGFVVEIEGVSSELKSQIFKKNMFAASSSFNTSWHCVSFCHIFPYSAYHFWYIKIRSSDVNLKYVSKCTRWKYERLACVFCFYSIRSSQYFLLTNGICWNIQSVCSSAPLPSVQQLSLLLPIREKCEIS